MRVIGIDLGTTSICGVVLDAESGAVLWSETVNSNAFLPADEPWEKLQDAKKITSLAHRILERALTVSSDTVIAIGVTGQMHGIVYTNAKGCAVSPLFCWQDGRGNLPYAGSTYAQKLKSFSGYGNVTDFYNRTNGLVPAEAVSYCTVADYFVMQLCGLDRPILHSSNAAGLGCYDPERMAFDYSYAPAITNGFEVAGHFRNIPVAVALGDNQASVFATLANEEDMLLNIGTGSQISLISQHPIKAPNIENRPYVDGKYLIAGSALCGGRAYVLLKVFYDRLLNAAGVKNADVYGLMKRLSDASSDDSLLVDTRFSGTREDPALRGSITNISTENFTPESLTNGVLRGMITELYGLYLSTGEKRCNLVGSGNGLRKNKALRRMAETVFGGQLLFPAYAEEAACGAALFALVACGHFQTASQAQSLIRYL